MGAKTFEELRAWQFASELSDRVVAICEIPALRQDPHSRDQLRNAVEAAPRLIAEGFGRWGHRAFAHYLVMARSEVMEVKSDLLKLRRRQTLPPDAADELIELSEVTIKTINRLRSSLE
jgi:four helix bundle protein